ncbi:unnamed protein product [Clavelina lepadiformis]|uniref:Secreted protein n=1 Tax=Clavelina lepadiformis TaxID=159417 RepID=A0ABP0G8G2_CLALP
MAMAMAMASLLRFAATPTAMQGMRFKNKSSFDATLHNHTVSWITLMSPSNMRHQVTDKMKIVHTRITLPRARIWACRSLSEGLRKGN